MNATVSDELFSYAVRIRRQLHEYPELGIHLEKTVKLVSEELEKLGIAYTTRFGKSALVADLGQGDKCIALRADMDALPIQEKTNLPFASKIPGQMHACGHDAHTAVLLAVAKRLKAEEDKLPCRVRLIFQPSEEDPANGAKLLTADGVCEGVDHILAAHCEPTIDAGTLGIHSGDYMAACISVTLRFFGRTAHAALPEAGIDAIAMGVEAYTKSKEILAHEAGERKYIWTVGHLQGGKVHNIVADECVLDISFRYFDTDFASRAEKAIRALCNEIAQKHGGRAEVDWTPLVGPLHNDEKLTIAFEKAVTDAGILAQKMPPRMTSEDFSYYLEKMPGMLFRFGTRNEKTGCTAPAHRNDFCIDEEGMKAAILAFYTYVMQTK